MSLPSVGIDLVSFEELRGMERDQLFLKKIFTPNEIRYCKKKSNPIPFLAARFAAKEAVIKALGALGEKIFFSEIEIIKSVNNSLEVLLMKHPGIEVAVSFCHGRNHAVAVALAQKNGEK